jgi:hypothetical protein
VKLNKFTIILLSVSIIALSVGFVVISQNTAYGGIGPLPFSTVSANPASTLAFKGTQYAIVVQPGSTSDVDEFIVTFPAGTTIPASARVSLVTLNDQVLTGTTTLDDTAKTIKFTLSSPVPMDPTDKLFILIQKVRNPATPNPSYNLTIETRNGGIPVDLSSNLGFGIQEVLSPGAIIADNTNFKVGIGNNVTPDETLTVVGNIKLSGNIVSNGPINIIPNGDICIGTGC